MQGHGTCGPDGHEKPDGCHGHSRGGIRGTRGRDGIGVHRGRDLTLGRGVKGGDSVQKEDFRGRRNSKGRSDRAAKGGKRIINPCGKQQDLQGGWRQRNRAWTVTGSGGHL